MVYSAFRFTATRGFNIRHPDFRNKTDVCENTYMMYFDQLN